MLLPPRDFLSGVLIHIAVRTPVFFLFPETPAVKELIGRLPLLYM